MIPSYRDFSRGSFRHFLRGFSRDITGTDSGIANENHLVIPLEISAGFFRDSSQDFLIDNSRNFFGFLPVFLPGFFQYYFQDFSRDFSRGFWGFPVFKNFSHDFLIDSSLYLFIDFSQNSFQNQIRDSIKGFPVIILRISSEITYGILSAMYSSRDLFSDFFGGSV